MTQPRCLLEVQNVHFSYSSAQSPSKKVLHDISFKLHEGECLGILGPNGGGKSTLLKLLMGELVPQSGKITYHASSDVRPVKKHFWRPYSRPFSYLPQKAQLNDLIPLTVYEFVKLGLLHRDHPPMDGSQEEHFLIGDMLEKVGLSHLTRRSFRELSGGEKQRVLLAKAFIQGRSILILDEPHAALDRQGLDLSFSLIKGFMKEHKLGLILVDHNIPELIEHCHWVLCLNKTHHWHDKKGQLNQKILESIYHCEFEHLLLHEHQHPLPLHQHCDHGDDSHHLHHPPSPLQKKEP
jgi:zinc transport system ATP-binding protein